MSNIYITEPPTSGKVLLKTTVGDIDIELWAKETPKTCRNFIQLCLEGYYDGTLFHRVVKGFIAQGGDPNGDGTGGESIYGEPFKDEFHSRLRFNRRGLVAMANAGKDDNGSQFFFTLAPTPELQNKHTLFGKISGLTVFNMIKLEEGIIEHERPEYPHKILKTEVLSNPFPDIQPRMKKVEEKQEKVKVKQPGVKNFKLLSFGEEAEEDEEETLKVNTQFAGKSKSTHDLLDDPKLSSQPVIGEKETKSGDEEEPEEEEEDIEAQLESIRAKLKSDKRKVKQFLQKPSSEYYLNQDINEEKKRKAEEIREEIKKVKKEYQENKLEKEKKDLENAKEAEQKDEIHKEYKEEFDKYKEKKKDIPKKGKSREDFTLQLLQKFKNKLGDAKEKYSITEEKEEKSLDKKKEDKEDSDPEDTSWLAHQLHFKEDTPVLAKDANTKGDDWFEIYDPRNPINKRRREEGKKYLANPKRK